MLQNTSPLHPTAILQYQSDSETIIAGLQMAIKPSNYMYYLPQYGRPKAGRVEEVLQFTAFKTKLTCDKYPLA